MNLKPIEVKDKDGKVTPAQEAVCNVCDGNTFHITVIKGHNHLICANPICNECFCQIGACQ
jgi:hypothetical protein